MEQSFFISVRAVPVEEQMCFSFAVPIVQPDDFIACPVAPVSFSWLTVQVPANDPGKYSFTESFQKLSKVFITVGQKIRRFVNRTATLVKKFFAPVTPVRVQVLPLRL